MNTYTNIKQCLQRHWVMVSILCGIGSGITIVLCSKDVYAAMTCTIFLVGYQLVAAISTPERK